MRAILIYLSFGLPRFFRVCVRACCGVCARARVLYVHLCITEKGVAARDRRQNTGNATAVIAWIGRTGVCDDRKGI